MGSIHIVKASAGSGKTFQLTYEYIARVIETPGLYRNILAVTFTNKATAEMKERILSQLYGIQIGDKDSQAYLDRIKKETGSAKWTVISLIMPLAAGFIICTLFSNIARLFI